MGLHFIFFLNAVLFGCLHANKAPAMQRNHVWLPEQAWTSLAPICIQARVARQVLAQTYKGKKDMFAL
jgi:hypothetical protein